MSAARSRLPSREDETEADESKAFLTSGPAHKRFTAIPSWWWRRLTLRCSPLSQRLHARLAELLVALLLCIVAVAILLARDARHRQRISECVIWQGADWPHPRQDVAEDIVHQQHAASMLSPPTTAIVAASLPVCPRTLMFVITGVKVGLGSKLDQLLTAAVASLREHDNRYVFVEDVNWDYVSLSLLFLPTPALTPVLDGWNDPSSNRTEAMWEQLSSWPSLFSIRPLTLGAPPSGSVPHFLAHEAWRDVYSPSPSLPSECDRHRSPLHPHVLLPHNCHCSAEHGTMYSDFLPSDLWTISNLSRRSHVRSLHGYGYVQPWVEDLHKPMRPFAAPPDVRRRLALSAPHLHSSRLQRRTPLPAPSPMFVLKQRLLHHLAVLRPEIREAAAAWMKAHSLRSRSAARRAVSAILRPEEELADSAETEDEGGSGWVAVHIRRQDKGNEATVIDLSNYTAAVRDVLATDPELGRSFPPFPSHLTAASCTPAWIPGPGVRWPQVALMTDEPAVVEELRRLVRGCWNVVTAFEPAPSLIRRDDFSQGWWSGRMKEEFTVRLAVELVLLSEADYAVLTLSSNVGLMVQLSRGWQDSVWEGRVRSLDQAMRHFPCCMAPEPNTRP